MTSQDVLNQLLEDPVFALGQRAPLAFLYQGPYMSHRVLIVRVGVAKFVGALLLSG